MEKARFARVDPTAILVIIIGINRLHRPLYPLREDHFHFERSIDRFPIQTRKRVSGFPVLVEAEAEAIQLGDNLTESEEAKSVVLV